MAPSGTVRSSGPSANRGNALVSPRISTAFGDTGVFSFVLDGVVEQLDDIPLVEAGFGRLAQRVPEELAGARGLRRPAAIARRLRDERPKPLTAVDDALALELFIGALDGNHADQQVLGELAKRGEQGTPFEAPLANLPPEAVDDLLIERARAGGGNRWNEESAHHQSQLLYCIY